MPPKAATKEKVAVAKGDEAEEMVAQYLKSVSTDPGPSLPSSPDRTADVSANLKNKVPKAAAQKVMMTLAEKGILTKKEYGKQVIFVYNQELLETLFGEDIQVLEKQTKETQSALEESRKSLKITQAELNETMELPKTKDLSRTIDGIKSDNERTLQALLPYRGEGGEANITPLGPKEIKKIDDDWTRWKKEWDTRRKVYKELLGMVTDGGQIVSVTEFQDDQGINVDDEEAIDVEHGEFGKPQPMARKPAMSKTVVMTAKRSISVASSQEESIKKKKVKKV